MRALLLSVSLVAALVAQSVAQSVGEGQLAPQPSSQSSLPTADAFYEAVRLNVVRSQREQNRYSYKERRTDVHTNPFGRLGTGGTRVIEVVPMPDGLTATRRLIERDDKPVSESVPEKFTLPRRNPTGSRNVDDIVRTLEFSIGGREMIRGESFVLINFAPRPNAKPSTRQGKMAKAFKGTMWVNEAVHEIERLEATAIDDLSFGLGFVARVRKGATVSAERRPVEGGVWLPTAIRFNGEGRAVLFRKLAVEYAVDWFDYRLVGAAQ